MVDGFAGRGRYTSNPGAPTEDYEGSPLIMLKSLIAFRDGRLKNVQFVFLFIELNEENYKFLYKEIHNFHDAMPSWPTNIQILVKSSPFEDVTNNGIDEYVLKAPVGNTFRQATFLFVDPFEFKGFSMTLLSQICGEREGHTVELFLNFMSDYILRFTIEQSQGQNLYQERYMAKLFGVTPDEWRKFRDNSNVQAEGLVELFTDQLRKHVVFKYILSLEMKREDMSPIYYLVYATRHIKGLEKMKEAMWKCDQNLKAKSEPPEALLLEYFQNNPGVESFKIEDINMFVLTKTPFPKSAGTDVLKELEKQKSIELYQSQRQGREYSSNSSFVFKGMPGMIPNEPATPKSGNQRDPNATSSESVSSGKQTRIDNYFKSNKSGYSLS